MEETKFCSECGERIAKKAVVCPKCGCQIENATAATPNVVINNSNQNQVNATGMPHANPKNKWVALLLWFLLGYVGGHKFYEGRVGMGILYIFTLGLFGIGYLIDFFAILFKSNPYYV